MNNYELIDNVLSGYRESDGNLSKIPDSFVFAYGPFMCMTKNYYEKDCDEIGKYNKWMQVMLHAAWLIRKITNGVSYGEAKKIIRDFNISIDNTFGSNDQNADARNALINFSNNYLSMIRDNQKAKKDLESFITCAAPIVPYNQSIRKQNSIDSAEEMVHADIVSKLPKQSTFDDLKTISDLLLNNLGEIMMNYNLCTVLFDNILDKEPNYAKLDKLILRNESVSIDTQKYYFLATVTYYHLQDSPVFTKYIKFFEQAGDFSKMQSYEAFEAMVNMMTSATDIMIATESLEDPTLDAKEYQAISSIVKSNKTSVDEKPKYDFGMLNDFINVKRFMKFEKFPNRLFIGSLEKASIVNVNNMGGDRNYYELDNDMVVCPFLDLRTYQPRFIVLHANTNDIEIIDEINGLF